MKHYKRSHIDSLEHLFKINLINSISGFKSANLIATKSLSGHTNVAVFSSVTHYGSNPPLLGFVLRPTTVKRDTYKHIKETSVFTINAIHNDIVEDAHHTSAKYPEAISEFNQTNLQTEYKNNFHAPFVKDCPIQVAMKFKEEYHIKSNDTILVIAEVMDLYIANQLLQEDGFIDLNKGGVTCINGLDAYLLPEPYKRLAYQRPKEINNS